MESHISNSLKSWPEVSVELRPNPYGVNFHTFLIKVGPTKYVYTPSFAHTTEELGSWEYFRTAVKSKLNSSVCTDIYRYHIMDSGTNLEEWLIFTYFSGQMTIRVNLDYNSYFSTEDEELQGKIVDTIVNYLRLKAEITEK